MSNTKKIGIVGLGPVGMMLAVKLNQAGFDVVLCDRNKIKSNLIKQEGIRLEGVIQETAHFDTIVDSLSGFEGLDLDYLIFALKSHQTDGSMQQAAHLNTEKLTVIAAQNGIDVEHILHEAFGESQILRMIINFAGNLSSPNVVKVTFFTPPNYIGSLDDSRTIEAELIANGLSEANLKTAAVNSFDIVKRAWEKTILNASLSALCGVGRLTMAEAMADGDTVELVEQIMHEAVEVASAEKINFPDDFIRKCMRYLKKGGHHFPSLAGDLINNRETEIDYFNGKIVEYGRKHYIRTSLNLAFTNMVKAMTNKNIASKIPGVAGEVNKRIIEEGLVKDASTRPIYQGGDCFLGVDLGSAFTKFTVINENEEVVFRYSLKSLMSDKMALKQVVEAIQSDFDIEYSCATGYGRKHFESCDMIKTEINCAAVGVSHYFSGEKNILDIGGEDIKVIICDEDNHIDNFYMNDKCAAGTGSFLSEIAEKTEIDISEMSKLAAQSDYDKELNSFCTVFAKTEIMNWMFEGMSMEDVSRGIYISIANRVAKLRIDPTKPIYMIGGVLGHHPFMKTLLNERFEKETATLSNPQHIVSFGAALMAIRKYRKDKHISTAAGEGGVEV